MSITIHTHLHILVALRMRFEKLRPHKPRYPYFHIQLDCDYEYNCEDKSKRVTEGLTSFLSDLTQFLEISCPGVRHFFAPEDVFVSHKDMDFFIVIRSWFLLRNEVEAQKFYQKWNDYYHGLSNTPIYTCFETTVEKAVVVDGKSIIPFWGFSRTEQDYFVGVYGGDYDDYFFFDDVGEYEQWIQEKRQERIKINTQVQEMVAGIDNIDIDGRKGEDSLLKPLQNLYIGTS